MGVSGAGLCYGIEPAGMKCGRSDARWLAQLWVGVFLLAGVLYRSCSLLVVSVYIWMHVMRLRCPHQARSFGLA